MNICRVYTLLVIWCFLLIAPGMIVEMGVFGRIGLHSTIPGSVTLLWVVGYLAQFGAFMWIANIVGNETSVSVGAQVVWWLLASLLPWAVDLSLPASPLFALVWLPVVIALAAWIALVARRAESLELRGIPAMGLVLEVLKPRMNVVVNNVFIKRKVRLRIEREDAAPPYEGILNGLFMLGEIPSVGDTIPLLVDPAKPQRFDYQKPSGAAHASPVRTLAPSNPAYSSGVPRPGPSQTNRLSMADELQKLADLRDRGALTGSEFAAAKKKLLRL